MTYTVELLVINTNILKEIVNEIIYENNINISDTLKEVYFTDTIMYERKIKELDPLKKPSLNAVGQFIFLNNEAYLVLNYDKIKFNIKTTIVHELTHIENHLIFIKDNQCSILLKNKLENKLLKTDLYKLIALDIVDEFTAIKNEMNYNAEYGYCDYLEQYIKIINNISKEKLIQQDKINFYVNSGYFRILPYILAYKNNNDKFPEELKNELYEITYKIEERLNKMYQLLNNNKDEKILLEEIEEIEKIIKVASLK